MSTNSVGKIRKKSEGSNKKKTEPAKNLLPKKKNLNNFQRSALEGLHPFVRGW